jgi:hypothetical protein
VRVGEPSPRTIVAPDLIPVVFGSQWEVSVGIIQVLSVYVIIRSLQSWSSIVLDAVGRPGITLWTQFVALCLTPLGVVIGAQWSVEAVAVRLERARAVIPDEKVARIASNPTVRIVIATISSTRPIPRRRRTRCTSTSGGCCRRWWTR